MKEHNSKKKKDSYKNKLISYNNKEQTKHS